jgi:(5-formylfuran-3-yl)methyl phosphate synthase
MRVPGLLVSVRSAAEARAALAGGAALIDVKEPTHGPLGRASLEVIEEVVCTIAGRCPVSAALGELVEHRGAIPRAGLSFVKWGLAHRPSRWREELTCALTALAPPQVVLTAYADWQCAQAPAPEEIFDLACAHSESVLLLDTYCKDASPSLGRRPTLLDWLSLAWIEDLCQRCRREGVRIALAGSLGPAEIATLLHVDPTWFAVRGAVCADEQREAAIDIERVRALAELLRA